MFMFETFCFICKEQNLSLNIIQIKHDDIDDDIILSSYSHRYFFANMIQQQPITTQRPFKDPIPSNSLEFKQIHYFFDLGLFGKHDIQLFSQYKTFIENTIIELGEDWRIQSTLLSEEISTILSENESPENEIDEGIGNSNIFNDFLLCFVRDKISKEKQTLCISESKLQDAFSEKVQQHFGQNQKIISSLTFNTLSLGFCITAADIWKQVFDTLPETPLKDVALCPFATYYQKQAVHTQNEEFNKSNQTVNQNTQNIENRSQENSSDLQMRKKLEQKVPKPTKSWRILELEDLINKKQYKNVVHTLKKQKGHKRVILGEFVSTLNKFKTGNSHFIIVSLLNQFYQTAFIAWLIFNIKAFFSLSFNQYLEYFKGIYSKWEDKLQGPLFNFFTIIEKQWSILLKDYSVALNDDLEVLYKLVERIKTKTVANWQEKSEVLSQYAFNL